MEPVTQEEMVRTCALQAVRIEKLQDQNRNLVAVLEANNQQLITLVEEKNELVRKLNERLEECVHCPQLHAHKPVTTSGE